MISAISVSPSFPTMKGISQSNSLVSIVHKLALATFSYLATSLYIPSSWVPVALSCFIGISVALIVFSAMEHHSYETYPIQISTPIPYRRKVFHRPIEICRPPVSYPFFKRPLPPTSFHPRMDRVGERGPFR